eukprot:s800_g3.t1
MNKYTIIPYPEKHFSFSTNMMVLAVQLYREKAAYDFHPFTQYAWEKLLVYVESRQEHSRESYRHFVEHAYNQFFVHPAFLESARSRTRAKDIGASEPLGTSTKLDGYVWIQDRSGTKRIPKSKVEEGDDEPMEEPEEPRPDPYAEFPDEMKVEPDPPQPEHQEEEMKVEEAEQDEEEVPDVPSFEVKVREPGTSSTEVEEVQLQEGRSGESEEPYERIYIYDSAENRYGHYIMSFFDEADQLLLRRLTFALRNVQLDDDEEPVPAPETLEEVSPWSMKLIMEVMVGEQFETVMGVYLPAMQFNIDHDTIHALRLKATTVKLQTQHVKVRHFEDNAKPELPSPMKEETFSGDPEFREIEDLENKVNKFEIEGEDDSLIDLTVRWLKMFNKSTRKVILDKSIKEEKQDAAPSQEEEGIIYLQNDDGEMISPEMAEAFKNFQAIDKAVREEQARAEEITRDPIVPPPEHINQHLQDKEDEADARHGRSFEEEAPDCARSSEEEEADEQASEKPKERKIYYDVDITECEEDSILRQLSHCFPDAKWDEWTGFYGRGFPVSDQHKHMFWHEKYRCQDQDFRWTHQEAWYQCSEEALMTEYIARHKGTDPESDLEELRNTIAFTCVDPRTNLRNRLDVERLSAKAETQLKEEWDRLESALSDAIEEYGKLPYCAVLQSLAMSFLGANAVSEEEKDPDYPYRSGKALSVLFWNLGNWCRSRFSKTPLPVQLEKFAPYIDDKLDVNQQPIDLEDRPVFNNYFVTAIKNLGAHIFLNCEALSVYPFRDECCATQERLKNYWKDAAPVRVKHFVTASYHDLMSLKEKLFKVMTKDYTDQLARETDCGDCCLMSIIEWGHSRRQITEDNSIFEDQEHMGEIGEFTFQVNETCLHNDHNMFLINKNDNDSHNPFLIHLRPHDWTRQEANRNIPIEHKKRRKQTRKETQRANRQKRYEIPVKKDGNNHKTMMVHG